jgi:hypothetical protein
MPLINQKEFTIVQEIILVDEHLEDKASFLPNGEIYASSSFSC